LNCHFKDNLSWSHCRACIFSTWSPSYSRGLVKSSFWFSFWISTSKTL